MWKLIDGKIFAFFMYTEDKEFLEEYVSDKLYGFSALVRKIIENETNKYMSEYVFIKNKLKNMKEKYDKTLKNDDFTMTSVKIEKIDLNILQYLAYNNNTSTGGYLRQLIHNEVRRLKENENQ